MISVMLTYQPFLMGGIDDHEMARKNSNGAMGTFFFTFVLSVVFLIREECRLPDDRQEFRRRRSGRDYEGIPQDMDSMQEYTLDFEIPPIVQDLPPTVQQGYYS